VRVAGWRWLVEADQARSICADRGHSQKCVLSLDKAVIWGGSVRSRWVLNGAVPIAEAYLMVAAQAVSGPQNLNVDAWPTSPTPYIEEPLPGSSHAVAGFERGVGGLRWCGWR